MQKIIAYSCLILCLSGCAEDQLYRGLQALMGKDATTAFDVIGYPSGKQTFGDKTVYSWDTSKTILWPETATTHGTIGTTPFYGTTTSLGSVNCYCLIRLVANQKGKLISWELDGNVCGCSRYDEPLTRYYKSQTDNYE